jgi:hypothetical protein
MNKAVYAARSNSVVGASRNGAANNAAPVASEAAGGKIAAADTAKITNRVAAANVALKAAATKAKAVTRMNAADLAATIAASRCAANGRITTAAKIVLTTVTNGSSG